MIAAQDAKGSDHRRNAELDNGLPPSPLGQSHPAERENLRAVAQDGENGSRTSELADRYTC